MKSIKCLLLIIVCCCPVAAYSQYPKIKAGIQYGFLNGGCMDVVNYGKYTSKVESEWGWNTSVDVSYFITRRFFITLHLSEGSFNYSADRKYKDATARGKDSGCMSMGSVGVLAGYSLPITSWSNLSGQIGFSQFNLLDEGHSLVYYFPDENSVSGNGILQSSSGYYPVFSASIPVKISLGFMPFKKMNVGVARNIELAYTCGMDIEPDFGFSTFIYHGPQLSISF